MATLADVLRQTGYAQDGTLATPASESPMTKVLAEHIKSLPQKFEQNQAQQMSLLNQAFPGNTYESMMTQGDPKALAELAMQAPFNAMIAYHGTPHTIKGGFDISKVGTGEGAQAYGHGMYFAENPNVARSYATTGKYETPADYASHYLAESKHDPKAAIEMLKKEAALFDKKGWDKADIPKEMISQIEEALKKGDTRSNLYKVDIPDEHIPNMLDWDKPLSQQPKIVQDAFKTIAKNEPDLPLDFLIKGDATGGSLIQAIDKIKASKLLLEQNVPGIRYLDAGSRPTNIMDTRLESLYQKHGGDIQKAADDFMRTIHESPKKKAEIRAGIIKDLENRPTSNFVVFDPSTVKILEENSKPVSRKEIIEKQVKALKD
jgi:hypothetical protein